MAYFRLYPDIYLEGLWKAIGFPAHDNRSAGQDMKEAPPNTIQKGYCLSTLARYGIHKATMAY